MNQPSRLPEQDSDTSMPASGSKVAILGYGRFGRALAELAVDGGLEVVAYDPAAEVLPELAAMPVEDIGGNFTARPRPTGQVPISKTEMIRFVEFITTHLIAFAFREENRVVFVLALPGNDTPYLLGIKKD